MPVPWNHTFFFWINPRNHTWLYFRKYYSSGPAELFFGGKRTGVKGLNIIFDSGSSFTYFNSQAYETIVNLVSRNKEYHLSIFINSSTKTNDLLRVPGEKWFKWKAPQGFNWGSIPASLLERHQNFQIRPGRQELLQTLCIKFYKCQKCSVAITTRSLSHSHSEHS